MAILTIENLSKNYGAVRALNNISFAVPEKTVFGILGPNGSGKTTLLGIAMDILKATSGSYTWTGEQSADAMRKKIGTLLETPNFYHYLSAEDNLRIAAKIKGKGEEDIPKVLEMVNLYERKDSKFNTYSLGMKQRLAIASTLLGDPDILVFDEPTNGLDPAGIAEIRELIKELNRKGKTIIMASHILDEVEKVCSHVAIIKNGDLLATGEVGSILSKAITVEIASKDTDLLRGLLADVNYISKIENRAHVLSVSVKHGFGAYDLSQLAFEKGIVLTHLVEKKRSLEQEFLQITSNN